MKELIRMFETIWVSVAFAEAGEQEAAREFTGQDLYEAEETQTCQAL
ncbi:MAG: hypothetical protein AABZ15_12110 [Nitrospirota bacterium]